MKSRKLSGFTLIELLVVIAIIAILAAILFPVFAQAREKARQTSCISNSKEVGLAVLMYVQDYDEVYPYAQPGNWQYADDWLGNTQPYIKSLQILRCPSDPHMAQTYSNGASSGAPFSYPGNGITCYGPTGWQVVGIFNARQTWWSNWSSDVSLASVGLPAETILTGERHSLKAFYGRDPYGVWDLNDVIFYGWNGDIPGQGVDANNKIQTWTKPTNYPGSVATAHNKQATFTFSDGHTKSMNPIATVDTSAANNESCSTFQKMWDRTRTQ